MQKKVIVEKKLGIPPDYQYKAITSRNFIHSNWHKNKLETLGYCLGLKKTHSLLDLGIGSGNFEFYFHKKVKRIVGVDYNGEAIDFAKDHLKSKGIKNVRLFKDDIKNVGFLKHNRFDLIIMVDVIEHFRLSDTKKIVKSFKKLLRKGGQVCIVTPNFDSTWVVIEWFLDRFRLAPEMGGKQHLSRYTPETLGDLFMANGYKIDRIVTFNTFSYLTPIENLRRKVNKWEINNLRNGNMFLMLTSLDSVSKGGSLGKKKIRSRKNKTGY